uniref:TmcB/TmcC TPR repeats domain-containing protein n=1 Tax=Leersia perrieri TaxID=77586 RepID=A0A0D9W723_9ORYZ
MLLRSSSTPFLHHHSPFLLSPSSSPSSLQLRRAFSDGHLPSQLHSDGDTRRSNTGLHTELSFSVYNTFDKMPPPPVKEQEEADQQEQEQKQHEEPELPLFLARGLGIDRIASGLFTAGGGGDAGRMMSLSAVVEEEEEQREKVAAVDAQYKRMVDEQPGNALFLRNYAQFLHEVKGDARRAEEYYSRAMLADPSDGEIMSQYAKLVWEVHRDQDRSLTYFNKSVQAAPQDSNVLAAYASFLWEQDDDDEEPDVVATAQPVQMRELATAAV